MSISLLFFKTSMLESDIQQSRGQTAVSCLIDFLVLIQNISELIEPILIEARYRPLVLFIIFYFFSILL